MHSNEGQEQKKYRERPTGPIHGAWEAECLRAHTVIVTQSAGVGLCGSVCIHTVLNLHRALFHVCTSLFLSVSPAKFANFFPAARAKARSARRRSAAPKQGGHTGPGGRNTGVHTKKLPPDKVLVGGLVCPTFRNRGVDYRASPLDDY